MSMQTSDRMTARLFGRLFVSKMVSRKLSTVAVAFVRQRKSILQQYSVATAQKCSFPENQPLPVGRTHADGIHK